VRICFVGTGHHSLDSFPEGGGIETQIWGISTALCKRGYEVTILSRNRGFNEKEVEGVKIIGVKTVLSDDFWFNSGLTPLVFSKNAFGILKKIDIDILNLSERFSAFFLANLSIPKIYTVHNPDFFRFMKRWYVDKNPLNVFFFDFKAKLEESVMKRCQRLIALNESTKNYMCKIGFNNIELIPNGIDYKSYKNLGDGFYILYVGRLEPEKKVECLIRAFNKIANMFPNYILLIIGRGSEEKKLRIQASRSKFKKRIRFVTQWLPREKLLEVYAECSAFVLPSITEVQPVVLLEAMASCKPVIASDIIGPRDIIEHGVTGFLTKPGDISALAHYIELILADHKFADQIGRKARERIKKKYTFDHIAERHIELYSKVLSENRL